MKRVHVLIALLALGLLAAGFFYKNETAKGSIPGKFINNSHFEEVFEKVPANTTNGTKSEKEKFIIIYNASNSGGGGASSGGGGTGGCSGTYISGQQGDYYVKGRVVGVENVPNGNEVVSYTYTVVDEYNKKNQSMPDLSPGNLVVISTLAPPGGSENPKNPFIYFYIEKTSDGYAVRC